MKLHHPFTAVLAVLITSAILVGCSNDSPVEPNATDLYFQQVVAGGDPETRDLFTSDIEALDESAEFMSKAATFRKEIEATGPITPIKFGRSIKDVSRSVIGPTTMYGDTVAIVRTRIVITGHFVIKVSTVSGTETIRKPFTETLHRNLRFERVPEDDWDDDRKEGKHDDDLFKWKLVAASIVNGGTAPLSPVMQSVELITPIDSYIVTLPDEYFMAAKHPWKIKMPKLKDVPITIRVTLTSSSADAEIVTLHHLATDEGLRKQQFDLISETETAGIFTRVYERTWFSKIKAKKKYGHLVVSALSHASMYDDDPQLYSSTIWGIPYLPSE